MMRVELISESYPCKVASFQESKNYSSEESWKDLFPFLVETMEAAGKSWHETSKVDPRVYFLLDKKEILRNLPLLLILIRHLSPHTHNNFFSFSRQYAMDSFARAACLIALKSIISYPQVTTINILMITKLL